jgi:DNA invertase Pin-like site-specific DNA recombinase
MADKDYKVGVYVRLSKEDDRAGESVSIENQKLLLMKHVKEKGWELVEVYQDDGFSGTNQNRPGLQRLILDVKEKRINTVVIKDLSRLGRNYLEVGNLAEVTLPSYGCELISLNEKIDDLMFIRNWFNEQHSKETSKKVKTVKRMFAQSGKFMCSYAPYGFVKNPENKHQLVIDEVAAPVVRQIFELRAQGKSRKEIAVILNESGIKPPRDYYYERVNQTNPYRMSHFWNKESLISILKNEAYIGNSVQMKTGSTSYKNRKLIDKPQDEWIRVDGTHEPIIDMDLWEQVKRVEEMKISPRNIRKTKAHNYYTGILYCADCGFRLRANNQSRVRKNGDEYHRLGYVCGNYSRAGRMACADSHYIAEEALGEIVLQHIRKHAEMVEYDEERIIQAILKLHAEDIAACKNTFHAEIKANQDRLDKLNRFIEKLYEDRVNGVVPEEFFKRSIQNYEKERIERQQTVEALKSKIEKARKQTANAETWTKLIRPYTRLEKLDSEILLTLIDRITVGKPLTEDGSRVCDISIDYNYVGNVDWLTDTLAAGGDSA